jgi:ketosteroid isomerase-like protein
MADNVSVIRGVYDAFARGDVPAVLGTFDPNIEWSEAEHFPYWTGQPFRGPQAIVDGVFMRLGNDFDGFGVHVLRIVGTGDTVLSEVRYRGKAKATGKSIDVQAAHVWDLRAGKIVKFQQYVDTLAVSQATGITPKI